MIDVSVKTLDGQTKSHSVEEDITVRQFKDIISSSISIPADTQRLIFQGRVLQDEKLLRDYNVHNKVIHVVQRPPPRSNSSGSNASTNSTSATAPPPPTRDVNSFVVGSFTLPSEILDPNQVQTIVQQAVHNMGELGRNARVSTRSSADGSAVDVHINLGQIPVQQINESQQRVNHIKKLLSQIKAVLSRLENPSSCSTAQSENSSPGSSHSHDFPSTIDGLSDAEADSGQASSGQQSNSEQSTNNGQAVSPPPASLLVELMGEIQAVQLRLEPFLNQYTALANNDTAYNNDQVEMRQNGRLFNLVSECLHYLGHIYHGVSDLALDLNQTPPRHLHAHTALPTLPGLLPSGINPGSIPVQVNQAQYRMGGGGASGLSGFTSSTPPRPSASQGSSTGTNSGTSTVTSTITVPTAAAATTATSSSRATPIPLNASTLPIRLPNLTFQTTGHLSSATPLNLGQSFATSSSSPYLFVEVGPDSLTVNSVSAHVVSSVDTNSTSTANTSSAPRTIQLNLDPVATNAPSTSTPVTTTNSAVSTETNSSGYTSTSTSTTTTSTPNSGIGVAPGRATVVLPGGMPNIQGLLGSQHNARTIDPYLPCMSRHFIASQTQNTAAGASTGSTSNVGNVSNQQSSNQAADAALGDVVAAVMAGLLGTNESQTANLPTDAPQTGTAPSASRPTSNPVIIPQFSQAIGGLASPVFAMVSRNLANMTRAGQTLTDVTQEPAAFVQTLRNLLQGAARGPTVGVQVSSSGGPSSSATTTNTTASTYMSGTAQTQPPNSTNPAPPSAQHQTTSNSNQAIPDEAIVQLIRGISNNLTQAASGQQNVGTIWDVFSSISDELDIEQFEGLNNDIFQCVARHFTIPDLMTVLLGNTEPLNRLREPLRDLVLNRILNGAEPTEANVQNAVLQLLAETREEIRVLVSIADVQPNIDAEGTLTNFLKHQYSKIIKLIIECDDSFGSRLYEWFKRFLSELIVLGRHCLVGGYPAFQRLVHDRLHHLTNGINAVMQQSMITMATLQLNAFTPQQTEDDIVHYIMWRDSEAAAESSSTKATKEAKRSEADGSSTVAPMDVDDVDVPSTFSQNKKSDKIKKDERSRSQVNGVHMEEGDAASVYSPLGEEDEEEDEEEEIVAASSNGDDWCNVVPAEWVPIIRQDIQQQRRQNLQPPFSDTYLSGMPAKRRKMNHGKSSNLSEGSEFVSDSLKKAVASAGVEPLSSLENLSSEVAHDSTLHSAFEEQICHNVLQRIHLDSDYNPERFPNTEEYFKNQHGK